MEDKTYSVYMHKNKLNGKIYIGITGRKPEKRWGNLGRHYIDTPYFWNAIQKYGWDNFEHIILHTGISKEQAERDEIEYIKKYDSTNRDRGYNIQAGGSTSGHMSEEAKKKISIANTGKETWLKGKQMPEETKRKIGLANSGKQRVLQYDRTNGQFINIFDSLYDASKQLGINRGEICAICNSRAKSIFGYIFRYESDEFQEGKNLSQHEIAKCKNSHFRPVKQYDMNGIFIKEYPSIKDAELALGKEPGTTLIWHCLNHRKPSAVGYLWSYANENVVIPTYKNIKPVNQYDLKNNYIKTFKSITEAASSVNGNASCMIKKLKDENNSIYKGFIWKYA